MFFKQMVSFLSTVGGKDIFDTTRRLMSRLLKHELSLILNWTGRQGKISFQSYTEINKLILTAVRKHPLGSAATEKEVESVIKAWLRNSYDREGGRQKRKQQAT